MQKFDYRAPRFSVDIPARLTTESSTQLGRCREISTEGMRLELRLPLPPDSLGRVSMSYQSVTVELGVRVMRSEANFEGLKFLFECDEERNVIAHLVTLLAAAQRRPRPVLLS